MVGLNRLQILTGSASLPVLAIAWMMLLSGCQAQPRPAAGMASLRISVVAEPKVGSNLLPTHVAVYDGPHAPRPQGDFEQVDYAGLDDIVIWIEPASGSNAGGPSPGPVTIAVDARHPATGMAKPVSVGQRIILANHGAQAQVIYGVSDGNEFDLGKVAPGDRGEFVAKSAGLIEVLTDSTKDPVARFYAAPSGWVVMARAGDSVDFTNIPPGAYRIVSWHPRLPGTEQTITVGADQLAAASIKVGVNDLPKVSGK